ncbi:MAG: aminotransferase class IV [Alphaproteobacteria bacterium]|nr:aminotransferase class IV [Alphaproteobacteria bacterium]
MVQGSQGFVEDPRNDRVLLYLNGDLVPRAEARVSVFDAGFVLGDGVWEGFRLVGGRVAFLEKHLDRLWEGARAIDLDIGMDRAAMAAALDRTVRANAMTDGVHIRLMVTRGLKRTPNQDPRYTVGPATVVIVAEWKEPNPEVKRKGLRLFTSTIRTTPPDMFDMRLNSHSRLPLITALIQALKAGADEALMLDPHGFVASCNATNFFIVRKGALWTSTGRYSFNGITRGNVVDLARADGIPVELRDFTLAEVYGADEAFATGTFGGVTPIAAVDGRPIGGPGGPLTQRLDALYRALLAAEAG